MMVRSRYDVLMAGEKLIARALFLLVSVLAATGVWLLTYGYVALAFLFFPHIGLIVSWFTFGAAYLCVRFLLDPTDQPRNKLKTTAYTLMGGLAFLGSLMASDADWIFLSLDFLTVLAYGLTVALRLKLRKLRKAVA